MRIEGRIVNEALASLLRKLIPKTPVPITDWVQGNVDMSFDKTSSLDGKMLLYPYQVEPLAATEAEGVKEVTLCWGQRLGKSTIWKLSMLKRVVDGGLSGLIVYPTEKQAVETNTDTVMPLLMTLPEARSDLAIRGGKKKDSYHIPSLDSIIYFYGGGAQITSKTCNWTVLDETDFIKLQKSSAESENMSQLRALRLRMQTFRDRMLIACSSPSTYGGVIWENYGKGSMGEWNLRCLGCGALYPVKQLAFLMPDGKYAGLQWEKDINGDVIEDSIRWICPKCRRAHTYAEAHEMNRLGKYVHLKANASHRSFQCGALANPGVWTWLEIAQAQEDAVEPDAKKFLCNAVKGLPYKHAREGDQSISISDAIKGKQTTYPDNLGELLSIVVAAVDQQKSELAGEKYYVWVVRGWDEAGNSWLLGSGTDNSLEALDAHMTQDWHGHKCSLVLIDQGGFDNSQDLDPFVNSNPRYFYYKGDDDKTLKGKAWMPSETNQKLFLANAVKYQVKLLSLLYDPARPVGYKWQLPENPGREYFSQLEAVQPNSRMTKDGNGEAYQNWCAYGSARRDFFDAEKMALVALDVACFYLPPKSFVRKNKPMFIRKEWLAAIARECRLKKNGANV